MCCIDGIDEQGLFVLQIGDYCYVDDVYGELKLMEIGVKWCGCDGIIYVGIY